MSILIARCDAMIVSQVTTLTPVVANSTTYGIAINSKVTDNYMSDGSATAQEIVEGVVTKIDLIDTPEYNELEFTEDNAIITVTGAATGEPFTVVSNGAGTLTVASSAAPKGPTHWIAENFSGGALPANGDTVILSGLSATQGFLWGLGQSGVTLDELDIRHDAEAPIGLPEYKVSADGTYYQTNYRDTHLEISATLFRLGRGSGNGSNRVKINFGTNACQAIIEQTCQSREFQAFAPVLLLGGHASNSLVLRGGSVDLAMLPGYEALTQNWPTILVQNGVLRCGSTVSLAAVTVLGGLIETRKAVTTYLVRGQGSAVHYEGNITTLEQNGQTMLLRNSSVLTIATLNGYPAKTLDLTASEAAVTVTNMNIYATPDNPFTILDPNNKLVMTNAAVCQNGSPSLVIRSGANKNLRLT